MKRARACFVVVSMAAQGKRSAAMMGRASAPASRRRRGSNVKRAVPRCRRARRAVRVAAGDRERSCSQTARRGASAKAASAAWAIARRTAPSTRIAPSLVVTASMSRARCSSVLLIVTRGPIAPTSVYRVPAVTPQPWMPMASPFARIGPRSTSHQTARNAKTTSSATWELVAWSAFASLLSASRAVTKTMIVLRKRPAATALPGSACRRHLPCGECTVGGLSWRKRGSSYSKHSIRYRFLLYEAP